MLKGAQKRMIVVKTANSRVFEEAYFVMRTDTAPSDRDMVGEANRIIESCANTRRESKRRSFGKGFAVIGAFISGSVFGGGLVLLVMMIV